MFTLRSYIIHIHIVIEMMSVCHTNIKGMVERKGWHERFSSRKSYICIIHYVGMHVCMYLSA